MTTIIRPYASALNRLKDAGLRPTRQRLALTKMLFENGHRHVTAEQLHSEALGSNIRVSLATVYNTLHQFTEAGLLREIVVDPGRSYFDTNTSAHYHFYCAEDGLLDDIPAAQMSEMPLPIAPSIPPGTEIERIDIVVRLRKSPASARTASDHIVDDIGRVPPAQGAS